MVDKVTPLIEKQTTRLRKPLSTQEKLVCTIRFLATGESYSSLHYQYRITKSTISQFISEVCSTLVEVLKDYMAFPKIERDMLDISDQMFEHWQFPNCFGAMDGKHIAIFNPPGGGSTTYYNYKGFYSMVLLGLVKYNYQFTYVGVGCQGRISDGGVFKNTDLYCGIVSSTLNISKPRPLPKTGDPCGEEDIYPAIRYVIVGCDAFQLSEFMMKPYSSRNLDENSRVFNYRLSRFRRISENAFGILAAKFRIF